MQRKFVYLNKDNKVVLVIRPDDEVLEQAAMIAGLNSNPKFVEVKLSCPATFGWYFNGTDYVPREKESI